jgi:predicted dehydrogenase
LGGRLYRRERDELNDNSSVQYTFPDGKKMLLHTSHIANTWHGFRSVIHGSKGCAILGEGVPDPKFYDDWNDEPTGNSFWTPQSKGNTSHQTEHDRFFKAIRENREWNELDYGISATFTGSLGRMAVETGQRLTAEEAWTSTFQYVPDIDKLTLASDAPVMPDAEGNYRIPIPGRATINNPYQQ